MKFLKIFSLSLVAFFALTQFASAKTRLVEPNNPVKKVQPAGPVSLPVVNVTASSNTSKTTPVTEKKTKVKKAKKHQGTKTKTPKAASKAAAADHPVKRDSKGHILRN